MAFGIGNVASVSLNNSDISAYVESIDQDIARDEKTCPRLGGNQTVTLPGPPKPTYTMNGWVDPVIMDILAPMALAATQTAVPFSFVLMTGSTFSGNVKVGNLKTSTKSEDPQSWTCTLTPDESGISYA